MAVSGFSTQRHCKLASAVLWEISMQEANSDVYVEPLLSSEHHSDANHAAETVYAETVYAA